MQYGLAQAKARLSELTHLVDAGQEVVIAKHGRPGYRLVAVSALQAQYSATRESERPPSSLDDMAEAIEGFRSKSRLPQEPSFVAQWREGDRY
jgi:antitoxin (DNA-binding transcriptional repressor) of toxin-antitoxin stability system